MNENIAASRIEFPEVIKTSIDLSVVIRCGRDRRGLERCLKTVDENVEVVVSGADDAPFLKDYGNMGYKVAPHTFGNWSVAAQSGIDRATNRNVIIMDADSVFRNGSIRTIYNALQEGHAIVQPHVNFLYDNTPFSKLISATRTFENRREPKSYSPGLGLNIEELVGKIGIDGKVFNLKVAFGDDGDLDERRRAAGIDVFVADNALIDHDPVTLKHELRTQFQFGVGVYQIQQEGPDPKKTKDILADEFSSLEAKEYYFDLYNTYGIEAALFMLACRSAFVAGFISASQK